MKFLSILTCILFLSPVISYSQTADNILGKWQSAHGSGQIQILKRGDHYFGKIVWLKEPNDKAGKPKTDINNPSEELQSQPIIGLEVLKDLEYKGNNTWSNGDIYDPKSGRTYNCQVNIISKDKLKFRAYYGISILGKTETWTRVE